MYVAALGTRQPRGQSISEPSSTAARSETQPDYVQALLVHDIRNGLATIIGQAQLLVRRGIKKDVLKIGDTVKVDGFLAKDGSSNASGGKITFADGRQVFTAAAEDAVPK